MSQMIAWDDASTITKKDVTALTGYGSRVMGVDMIARRIMTLLSCFGGETSGFKSSTAGRISSVFLVMKLICITCYFLLCLTVTLMSLGSILVDLNRAILCTWYLHTALISLLTLRSIRISFPQLYTKISEVENGLQSLGINVNILKLKKHTQVWSCLYGTLTILGLILIVVDACTWRFFALTIYGDVIAVYGWSDQVVLGVIILHVISASLGMATWIYVPFHLAHASYTSYMLTREFNVQFTRRNNNKNTSQSIKSYRYVHMDLCDVVDKADSCLRFPAAVSLVNNIVLMLILLYTFMMSGNCINSLGKILFLFWFSIAASSVILIVVYGEMACYQVSNIRKSRFTQLHQIIIQCVLCLLQTTDILDYLLRLDQEDSTMSSMDYNQVRILYSIKTDSSVHFYLTLSMYLHLRAVTKIYYM